MWKAAGFLFCILLGGGLVSGTYELHVVRSDSGFIFVPKQQDGLKDVYADIRNWDTTEWRKHPKLAKTLIDNGHEKLIKSSIYNDLFGNWIDYDSASRKNNRSVQK